MADAPSGGSAWTVLELILAILLILGVLDHLTGFISKPATSPTTKTPKVETVSCAPTLIQPYTNQRVTTTISIAGSYGVCKPTQWAPQNTTALFAQVIDSSGLPISDYTAIPISTTDSSGKINFVGTITLNHPPVTSSGSIILVPANDPNQLHQTKRIPIKF